MIYKVFFVYVDDFGDGFWKRWSGTAKEKCLISGLYAGNTIKLNTTLLQAIFLMDSEHDKSITSLGVVVLITRA